MKQNTCVITALLCLVSFSSLAKVDDLRQEVKISAASQEADIKNNQIIFNGPVEVTQGSVRIHADMLRAFTKEGSGGRILVATGNPATYSQIMEDGRPAHASAKEIRYELSKRTLILKGNATLEQDGSQVTGDQIQYNIAKQQLIAESTGNDRVITIIQPESYQEDTKPETQPAPSKAQPEAQVEQPKTLAESALNTQEIK
ncbi:lipopolysaccharide transport periplasmic protein LptA [Shewanella sp. D64]|uniref:lipopolysaccharide transport periplasmic protein LptA n=1 Tax=unclassified Shewanella TaxID=196818 RepID=UPI0022BA6068|nr:MULTISPECIES: lipopolysaccharide transport periplasmic protein LptA [unclassified Shewanella]MEC4725620.1 lipopolysaccharide transport periplasmic protein LptA [Shewanella sp. D64]MEC4739672.1 lipopolysaccharide transport periplasmic protein LptA [Shewanella sp. E94]WBJ94863.1 lipopolysaccharide transport periplasmic protein LptA [Shewanella sp. MTB7]